MNPKNYLIKFLVSKDLHDKIKNVSKELDLKQSILLRAVVSERIETILNDLISKQKVNYELIISHNREFLRRVNVQEENK